MAPARLLNTAPSPVLMSPPLVHVVVPRLSIGRSLRCLLLAPLMLNCPVAGMVTLPPPLMVPPVQFSWPLASIVRSPKPVRVPPERVMLVLCESSAIDKLPPERTKFCWLTRLVMMVVPVRCLTVILPRSLPMKTRSAGPGSTPVLQ